MTKLLMVEDETVTRRLLSTLLRKDSFDVIEAENGKVAWEYLLSGPRPSCAIIDIQMPVLDGHELVTLIRQHELLHGLPIVIISGIFTFDEIEELFLMAPERTFFLTKPITMPLLRKYLSKLLENVALSEYPISEHHAAENRS